MHVLLVDRRGSGCNEVDRGHARSAGRLLADVGEMISQVKSLAGTEKVSLVGVSWGGKLALAAGMRQPEAIDRLVLVAPGLFPQVDLGWREKLAVGLAAVVRPRRRFPIPLDEPELFTDNPAKQAFIREDPLRLREATARFFAVSRALDVYVRRVAGRRSWPFAVTLLLAGRERIIDNGRTRRFAEGLGCRSLRIVEYETAAHTLEFEADPREYLAEIGTAGARG